MLLVVSRGREDDITPNMAGGCTPSAIWGVISSCSPLLDIRNQITVWGVNTPRDMGSKITLLSLSVYYEQYHREVNIPRDMGSCITLLPPPLVTRNHITEGCTHPAVWGVISPSSPPWILRIVSQGGEYTMCLLY